MSPLISVVIPLYNKQNYIKKTLRSVLKQTFKDYEIIIIDDGSTDLSLLEVNKIKLPNSTIYSQKNSGVSTARNKGIEISNGKFIAFLDADDYWFPDHLEELNRGIEIFPNHKVFCNNYKKEVKKNKFIKNKFSYLPKSNQNGLYLIENYFKSSLLSDIAWTSAVCIERELLLKNNLFDPEIISVQDTDLWLRIGLENQFIFNKKETTIYSLYIENTLSDSKNIDNKNLLITKNKNFESVKPYLKAYLDQNRFSIALQYKLVGNIKKFNMVRSQITLSNLSRKRNILLNTPIWVLKILLKMK